MKKILFLCVIAATLFGIVYAGGLHTVVRPNNTATPGYYSYNLVCDSTDTLQVDTFVSDTVELSERTWLFYNVSLTGFTLADSANDSLLLITQGWATNDGKFKTKLFEDTIPTTLGTLDSTAVISGKIKFDSTGWNQFYIQSIVKDSFILGEGIDTTVLRLDYRILESVVIDK